LTVKYDKVDGDYYIEYQGIDKNLNYILEIDPGVKGEKYTIFVDRPYSELKN